MLVKRVTPIFLVIMTVATLDVFAAPTLDQSHLGGGTLRDAIQKNHQIAQTFTVGIAGTLDSVDLDLNYESVVPTYDITVEIRTTTSGLPDGPASTLASVQFDTSVLTPTFTLYSIDFSPFFIPLSVGDQLAIVLTSEEDAEAAAWRGADDAYPGGKWYFDSGAGWETEGKDLDGYFQTYVEPSVIPAPAALHLVVIGFSYFVLQRRKFV